MKYKVGDTVTIKKDLIVNKVYGNLDFVDEMEEFLGKKAKITAIHSDSYSINLDDDDWFWTDEMFEN